MSMSNARPSGRRGGSGRGPRRSNPRDRDHRDERPRDDDRASRDFRPAAAAKPPVKQSLWQKIVGLFASKKPAANGQSRPEYRSATVSPRGAGAPPPPRQTRKPEAVEVTTPKLYVGNLSFDASESDLLELFSGVGSVRTAEVVSHKQTEKSKGFGFVTMGSTDEAKRAVEVLHDRDFMGRKLVVSGAKTPMDRSDS